MTFKVISVDVGDTPSEEASESRLPKERVLLSEVRRLSKALGWRRKSSNVEGKDAPGDAVTSELPLCHRSEEEGK